MKSLCCLAVGKLKTGHWKQAAGHYIKLLGRYVRVEEVTVKDAPGHETPQRRNQMEGQALLAKIGPKDLVLGLDEHGAAFSSPAFARAMNDWLEDPRFRPCFVLGGAYGLSAEVHARCDRLISLGPMTLPHELARVVLLEQIYRAMTILRGSGYHH